MTSREETYDLSLLETSRMKWKASPGLRLIYTDLFAEMGRQMVAGESLEVGSGIGVMKETLPWVVTSDIEKTPYVDRRISCYEIAESGSGWENILAVDVLHHLRYPMRFFASAAESLRPGGRLILNEPAATIGGNRFYNTFHHEPCRPRELGPPFELTADNAEGAFANMGMGVALFVINREWVDSELAKHGLRLVRLHFRDLLAYPGSGGFSKPQFLPSIFLRMLLIAEKGMPQWVLRRAALRMTIVLEKTHENLAGSL